MKKKTKYYNLEADKAFGIYFKEEPLLETSPQFHDSLEFAFIKKGNITAFSEKKSMELTAGDIFFSESYETHFYNYKGDISVVILVLSREYIHQFRNLYPDLTFPTFMVDKEKNKEIISFISEWLEYPCKTQLFNFGKAATLFAKLIEKYELKQRHEYTGDVVLKELLRYIHLHYLEDIKLETMAKNLGFTVEYCSKVLKKGLNCNFRTYINSLRLRKANELMNDKSLSLTVSQIIYQCGFSSPATFYRIKKQITLE